MCHRHCQNPVLCFYYEGFNLYEVKKFIFLLNLPEKRNGRRKFETELIGRIALAHLFPCEDVSCQFDLGEVAFADGFEQPVVADVWLVV